MQVWFDRLAAVDGRQGELFARDGPGRERAAALSEAVDALNERYARTLVGLGHCGDASSAAAGYAGAKIAYGRIPDLEDFRRCGGGGKVNRGAPENSCADLYLGFCQ